jgi:hypothetical protein
MADLGAAGGPDIKGASGYSVCLPASPQDLPGEANGTGRGARLRRPIDFAVRVLDDGMLTVQRVHELGLVAAGRAADPAGGRDVRTDDGVPPAGGALVGGHVLGLPPRWPGAARDSPQSGGPSRRPDVSGG